MDKTEKRKKLEELTKYPKNSQEEVEKNIKEIEKLGPRFEKNKFEPQVNCHGYALGLDKSEYYINTAKDGKRWANSEFIKYLLDEKRLKELKNPEENCLVLYFDEEGPKHSGIVKFDSENNHTNSPFYIQSKWGTYENLVKHALLDVPSSYGNEVKYYVRPKLGDVVNYFKEYEVT
jgi:hypothetical protein